MDVTLSFILRAEGKRTCLGLAADVTYKPLKIVEYVWGAKEHEVCPCVRILVCLSAGVPPRREERADGYGDSVCTYHITDLPCRQ